MVSVLTRVFGFQNLALAEDVVQDTFCRALEVWRFRGVPPNPSAWLMAAAKNRAVDVLRRDRTARTFAPELGRLLESEWALVPGVEELFAPNAVKDDQLRMMFSCCHPRVSEEAQVALILNILCGFSIAEIANAFVSTQSAIEKRITRAKKVLAVSKKLFDVTADGDFSGRLAAVQRALYLLFNEGYHGASAKFVIREELCREAMRLTAMLLEHPLGKTPSTFALAALMALHAARLPARVDALGNLNSWREQDRSRWDQELVLEGLKLMELSATGSDLGEFHVESGIASIHARTPLTEETDWATIVSLYDTLMALRPSPIIALNRAIAIGQSEGPERGIEEIDSIADPDRLAAYPFYSAALGEFEFRRGRHEVACEHFRAARALARNPMEGRFLDERISASERGDRQQAR